MEALVNDNVSFHRDGRLVTGKVIAVFPYVLLVEVNDIHYHNGKRTYTPSKKDIISVN